MLGGLDFFELTEVWPETILVCENSELWLHTLFLLLLQQKKNKFS